MPQCKNITHPFQNDPGTSQFQRLMPGLLDDAPKIDARTLADLLEYFSKLSRHINYYDKDLMVSDWQPFFNKSIPFNLVAISKFDTGILEEKFELYKSFFNKRPGKNTLQLLIHFMYYNTIYKINSWHLTVNNTGLPFEYLLKSLVLDRMLDPVRNFIKLVNSASKEVCIRGIDFTPLMENPIWNLKKQDLLLVDRSVRPRRGRHNRITGLMNAFTALWPLFTESIKLLSTASADSIEDSLFKQKEDQKQLHPPQLALLFAFLKLFQHLQSDLNSFTRKHLDFFFKEVLRLVPRPAEPDKAHIVFEIQKQLDSYLLKKGLVVKDAKDKNNQEISFALDDEIVVNKAQVEEVKTLFLKTEVANDNVHVHLLQGAHIAPKANKADGLTKDFTDGSPVNWPTLGSSLSKFIEPGEVNFKPYPLARIGFLLASPVLLLNEGHRTVRVQLYCKKNTNCISTGGFNALERFLPELQTALGLTYIIVTKELIAVAEKKGISPATITKLNLLLPVIPRQACCVGEPVIRENRIQLIQPDWKTTVLDTVPVSEVEILKELFIERRVLNLAFSGKESWITPSTIPLMSIVANGADYIIRINLTLETDKPSVSFFDKAVLKEDLETTLPVLKIELDNEIKIEYLGLPETGEGPDACCFEICPSTGKQYLALYQFFRQLTIHNAAVPNETQIEVEVCGVKDFVVQNDDNVMDPNGSVLPFGSRPKVPDFELINPPLIPTVNPNLIGPNFYVGSKEIFCKKWTDVRVNINWKDKPSNFKDYYRAYYTNPLNPTVDYGLLEDNFKMNLAFLRNGQWIAEATNRKLFDVKPSIPLCASPTEFDQTIAITYNNALLQDPFFAIDEQPFEKLEGNTRNGFIRINMRDQDFLHKDYAFILARQMMAFGRFPDALIEGAVYVGEGNTVIVFKSMGSAVVEVRDGIILTRTLAEMAKNKATDLNTTYDNAIEWPPPLSPISNTERNTLTPLVHDNLSLSLDTFNQADFTQLKLAVLQTLLGFFDGSGQLIKKLQVLIPNEPWTPTIRNMSLDYKATAKLTDIDLIHLYPFENTHKAEEIELQPALFPTHCDEGSLFIGMKQLVPGSNVNILFQLAEATANSEVDRADIEWNYLMNNEWKPLRKGFEVLEDATNGLTTSGIVKLSVPGNITTGNTVLPAGLHWIKVSANANVLSISETIGIHTQAIRATFANSTLHDQLRLNAPLDANKLSKLLQPDSSIKKVGQPYESFNGKIPESEGNYYIRVSEWLRHKGRGIQKFDYERLVLDAFPQIYKVKCINHNFWLKATQYRVDVNVAPGYVMVAVIPDLNKLKSGQSFEPKAPTSLLENIQEYLKKRTSPFARIKVVNPRYEKIDLCIEVQLVKGKDKIFYKNKLENDLRLFLAPWAIGEFEKLSFGQCINRSDIVRFIEARDYVDFIICLRMMFEKDCDSGKTSEINEVCPLTPRSILVGGIIDVCIPESDCERWKEGEDECSKIFDVSTVKCGTIVIDPIL